MQRKIIHIDMDCFYAAVEMRDNPEYRDIPIAVGGNSARGVLSTCNYLAREYGVRSAMPNHQALQLCPDLKIVNGRMSVYKEVSNQIREIFLRYTSIIEPLSLDEAYLDVSQCLHHSGSATLIAQQIRDDIFKETGLTASAGVAPCKFLAKIASDENKPNGQCVITPNSVESFVKKMPLNKISGIGKKTYEKLKSCGYYTCEDVRKSSVSKLSLVVGKFADTLYKRAHGIDDRSLQTSRRRKSLAIETTVAKNLVTKEDCVTVIERLMPKFEQRLEKVKNLKVVRQGIKLKFSDFTQTTVEQQVVGIDQNMFDGLLNKAIERGQGKSIRLIGLTVGFSEKEENVNQLTFDL